MPYGPSISARLLSSEGSVNSSALKGIAPSPPSDTKDLKRQKSGRGKGNREWFQRPVHENHAADVIKNVGNG